MLLYVPANHPDKIIGCKGLAFHPNGVVILGKALCYVNWSYYRHLLDSTQCFPYFRPMCLTVSRLKLTSNFQKSEGLSFFFTATVGTSQCNVVRLFQLVVWNTARVICLDISKPMPTKTRKLANINKFMRQKELWQSYPQRIYRLPLYKLKCLAKARLLQKRIPKRRLRFELFVMTKSVLHGESLKVWLQNFWRRQ